MRRKSPTVLVLTYVASGGGGGRAGGSGGSRKGQGGASPRPIVRPQQRGGAPFGGEGTGGRSEVDSRRSGSYSAAEDATFVQVHFSGGYKRRAVSSKECGTFYSLKSELDDERF